MATLSDDALTARRGTRPARPGLSPADDQQHHERPRMGDPADPGGDLGRRLLLHRGRGPPRRAADLCLAAADASPPAPVAVPALAARAAEPAARRCGARSCCWPCSTMSCPSPCSAGARRISPAALPRSSTRRRRSGASSSPTSSRSDERMTPRKIAGVLLGFAGVATMIGPGLLANIGTDALAQLACSRRRLCYALAGVWARRFRRMGVSPMSVTTGQLTAGALMMLPLALLIDQPWTQPLPPLDRLGRDRRSGAGLHRLRLYPLFPADRVRRRDQCAAGHLAGPAGRDPARRSVPGRSAGAAATSSAWR